MRHILLFILCFSLEAKKPDLFLLKNYTEDKNVSSWYMSEKLDGVRAYWDGSILISRSGKVFNAPKFFTKNFPQHELDGELWIKRDAFSKVVSIVNKNKAHQGWNEIKYMIFEVPNAKGHLLKRLSSVKETKYIKIIEQIKVKDKKNLQNFLKEIELKAGEGVVVRDASLDYFTGRNNNALKVKSYIDTECEVVRYNKGKGKYKGLLGSLSCKMQNKKIIKIGSGLTKKQRTTPPQIGAIIRFKYYGLTSKGNPRFPIFLRERK